MTIDNAWNGLSPRKRKRYIELHNTAKIAELNKRRPLSPSMEDVSSAWTPTIAMSKLDYQPWYLIRSRRVALQRWQRYRSDYPAACGGNKTIVPEKPFRIMDLPYELRREIFSLVLRQLYPVLHFPSDGSADALHGPVDVRLFAVSRQVFAEAVKVFYEENTFSISTAPSSYLKAMPLFMRQSTGSEAPRPTNSIRRVHIMFHVIDRASTETDAFRFLWKKFCEYLKTCENLRTVELSIRWRPERYFNAGIDLQINKLAEMLMNTRDIIVYISDVTTDGPHGVSRSSATDPLPCTADQRHHKLARRTRQSGDVHLRERIKHVMEAEALLRSDSDWQMSRWCRRDVDYITVTLPWVPQPVSMLD